MKHSRAPRRVCRRRSGTSRLANDWASARNRLVQLTIGGQLD
ncbi:hypothetical protein I545_4848 [Mycobacterium kansasii 662]|uniref:Uncharacterized protein n=2 Tax=Mycobacterium kansasii TaxID=1768 RepID=A0A1V3WWB9_MYCKA|nr:hypothetical protein I547_2397 [Mycobacterium kansasii 824]EUA13418.1 hypothetical protein I545_4848 [Mycobacterium kansasii 662]OOK64584.1 hypothetical protein BZL30_9027 [Mycobacterium kansasii]OOK71048.1 hypothetical protein BZL29_5825 [Mycobacterium kansasii]